LQGRDLIRELERRLAKERGVKSVTQKAICEHLGVTQQSLSLLRAETLTPKKVANLIARYSEARCRDLSKSVLNPIVEFLFIDPVETKYGSKWQIFWTKHDDDTEHPYFSGLRRRLEQKHGIYVFHDSRGRAIYAGKAQRLSLWEEMNNAFNRDRGEVQNIRRVNHPYKNVEYKGLEERKRQISKQSVALYDIASYASAYEVADPFIGKIEALIVRAFANDLLNVRMENF
jgi:hypothetical protein